VEMSRRLFTYIVASKLKNAGGRPTISQGNEMKVIKKQLEKKCGIKIPYLIGKEKN
jgi:hypothetical protein